MSLKAGSDGTQVTPALVFSLFSPLSLAHGISLLSRPDVIIADQTVRSFWARNAGDGLHVRLNKYKACPVKTARDNRLSCWCSVCVVVFIGCVYFLGVERG